jgi:hypothetical protein
VVGFAPTEGRAAPPRRPPFLPSLDEGPDLRVLESTGRGMKAPFSGSRREEIAVRGFLDVLVRGARTVITRVELGGTLYVAAVIGVLLTSQKEGSKR